MIEYNGMTLETDRVSIYQENGYLNMKDIIEKSNTFTAVISGRGAGKTVSSIGAIRDIGNERGWQKPFCFFMRRTASILNEIMNPSLNPFNDANDKLGTTYHPEKLSKSTFAIYDNDENEGDPSMIAGALSTLANIRGFAMPSCKVILYDEAVPESTQRPIRDEGDTLDNAYETINRNRELEGQEAVKFIALANNNYILKSEFALRWGIVGLIDYMIENNIEQLHDNEHELSVYLPMHSKISEAKQNTALYKRNKISESNNTDFMNMALRNISIFDKSKIKTMNTNEYKPYFAVNDLYFYKHKSRNEYYITFKRNGTFNNKFDASTPAGLAAIHENFIHLKYSYLYGDTKIYFSTIVANVMFEKIFCIK